MDKNAFAQKVLDAEEAMYRVAKSMLSVDADCEDAVSEAILKAYSSLGSLREEKFFKTWLIRILINECRKIQKSNKKIVLYDEAMDNAAAPEKEDYTDLYRAVMALPEKIRIAVVLYYIEGYSVTEIKSILTIPSGTVKSRLAKGRELLKQQLCDNSRVS